MVTFNRTHATGHATHEVLNQPPPLVDYNVFSQDAALVESVRREGTAWAEAYLQDIGAFVGSAEAMQWSFEANTITPVLHTHDRYGHRIDEVVFHPAWHKLMKKSISWGAHALAWREARPGAHVARAAVLYLCTQMEAGHSCPVSMTNAVVPVLRTQPVLAATYEPLLTSLEYDPGLRPVQQKLRYLLVSMPRQLLSEQGQRLSGRACKNLRCTPSTSPIHL